MSQELLNKIQEKLGNALDVITLENASEWFEKIKNYVIYTYSLDALIYTTITIFLIIIFVTCLIAYKRINKDWLVPILTITGFLLIIFILFSIGAIVDYFKE